MVHLARVIFLVMCCWPISSAAQDIEPRRWSHLPVNVSFLGVGYGFTSGDIFFNPVLKIEDASVDLSTLGVSYIHSFEWLGRTARLDVTVPTAKGSWEGLLNGAPASTDRTGLLDPLLRISVNLWGAPPLRGAEFATYRSATPTNTTGGVALGLVAPWGEYDPDRLIHLGSNLWILRPRVGVLHTREGWQF